MSIQRAVVMLRSRPSQLSVLARSRSGWCHNTLCAEALTWLEAGLMPSGFRTCRIDCPAADSPRRAEMIGHARTSSLWMMYRQEAPLA